MYRPMTLPPDAPKAGRDYTGLILLLSLVLFEGGLLYLVIAGNTPVSSMVRRMLETPGGAFSFLMLVVGVVFLTIAVVLAVARRFRRGSVVEAPARDWPQVDLNVPPGSHSMSRTPLGLAVPGAIVAWLVPLHFESLWWLLLVVPVGLVALVLTMVYLPYSLAPARDLAAFLGDSRAPRLTATLVAAGGILLTGWLLGGAMTQGWTSKDGIVPALVLLVLARLTFPLRRRRGP